MGSQGWFPWDPKGGTHGNPWGGTHGIPWVPPHGFPWVPPLGSHGNQPWDPIGSPLGPPGPLLFSTRRPLTLEECFSWWLRFVYET